MAAEDHITPTLLKQLLAYDPETGLLEWKQRARSMFPSDKDWRTWNTRFAGKTAGCDGGFGYVKIAVQGFRLQAHRASWAMVYGVWPGQIDHINHDRSDNRLRNLREVTEADNHKNLSKSSRNTSGVTGVSWHPVSQKWRARIKADGRTIHLGLFGSLAEASAARRQAEERLGFHENHGT